MTRAPESGLTGAVGVDEVCGKFGRISWGSVRNSEHDIGTDLLLAARDARRFDRGLVVGAQVKGGHSWFDSPELVDGDVVGWWFYENKVDHFEAWVTHGLPHLVVLYDLAEEIAYWVHVTAESVVRTGKGCKVLVPRDQTVDDAHRDALLDVAAQQKAAPWIEGLAFGASADQIPPARRLRYALLAPRLVAPHRNAGTSGDLGPEGALALLAQGRRVDLDHFAEQQASVPDPSVDPGPNADWRWRFVHAFWVWMHTDSALLLLERLGDAPDAPSRAASGAVAVAAHRWADDSAAALELLDSLVEPDDLAPVDLAWMLVQRARIRGDLGDVEGALDDAMHAQRQLPGDQDDLTVSAFASAAAWQVFTNTGGFPSPAAAITAGDTAIAWWRSVTVSSALGEGSDRVFRSWAQDESMRMQSDDFEMLPLFAAELNAELTGEHGAWRGVASRHGKHRLVRALGAEDVRIGIDLLRRSGANADLKLALREVWRAGPADALARAVAQVPTSGWTRTTARTNLLMFELAGDLCNSDAADDMVLLCLGALRGEAGVLPAGVSFLESLALIEALGGLMGSCGPASRRAVADAIPDLFGAAEGVTDGPLARLFRSCDLASLPGTVHADLLALASDAEPSAACAALLGELARAGFEPAGELLSQRVHDGDRFAVRGLGDVRAFDDELAGRLIADFAAQVRRTIESYAGGVHSVGAGVEPGDALVLLNAHFHDLADWDPLLALLADPLVAPTAKRGTCDALLNLIAELPPDVRERIVIDRTPSPMEDFGFGLEPGFGGLADLLEIALGLVRDDEAAARLAQLAAGAEREQRDVCRVLGSGQYPAFVPLLSSLMASGNSRVAGAAAIAVGRLVGTDPDVMLLRAATTAVSNAGALVPGSFAEGVALSGSWTPEVLELVRTLSVHPSARVRAQAAMILDAADPGTVT